MGARGTEAGERHTLSHLGAEPGKNKVSQTPALTPAPTRLPAQAAAHALKTLARSTSSYFMPNQSSNCN